MNVISINLINLSLFHFTLDLLQTLKLPLSILFTSDTDYTCAKASCDEVHYLPDLAADKRSLLSHHILQHTGGG